MSAGIFYLLVRLIYMKIISLNIWDLPVWFVRDRKERIALIQNFFHENNPDIICLQEAFDPDNRMWLAGFLREHGYAASDEHIESRSVMGRKMDTTGGLVIFSRFPILETTFIPFRRLFFSPIEALGRKGILITLLNTPQGALRIVNLHLHKKSFLWDEEIRFSQLEILFMTLQFYAPMPTVMAGDFNQHDLIENQFFLRLIRQNGFVHPECKTLEPSYRAENKYVNIWMNQIARSKRFDYIFYHNINALRLRCDQYRVIYRDEPLSDHDPVMLNFCSD